MSSDKDKNELNLIERMLKQGSHQAVEELARMVVDNPTFREKLRQFDPSGKFASWIFRYGAGAINLKNPLIEDVLHAAGSEIASAINRAGEAGSDEEKRKAASEGIAKADEAAVQKVQGILAKQVKMHGNQFYPEDCSHVPKEFVQRGEKPARMSLKDAVERDYRPANCGCYGRYLIAEGGTAAQPAKEAEAKTAPDKAPPKPLLPPSDLTVLDHFRLLRTEDVEAYNSVWPAFKVVCERYPDLERKFQETFHRRGSHEQFLFVVVGHPSDEWQLALDCLLGEVTPPEAHRKKWEEFLSRELRETSDGIKGLIERCKSWNVQLDDAIEEKRETIAELRAKRKEAEAKRRTAATAKRWAFWTVAVIAASVWVILTQV